MSQTRTPPWERTLSEYCEITSMLELAVRIAHDEGNPDLAKFAWSELCALQAVAEAANQFVFSEYASSYNVLKNAIEKLKEVVDGNNPRGV